MLSNASPITVSRSRYILPPVFTSVMGAREQYSVDVESIALVSEGQFQMMPPCSVAEWPWVRNLVSSSITREQKHCSPNTVVTDTHYVTTGNHLPQNLRQQ